MVREPTNLVLPGLTRLPSVVINLANRVDNPTSFRRFYCTVNWYPTVVPQLPSEGGLTHFSLLSANHMHWHPKGKGCVCVWLRVGGHNAEMEMAALSLSLWRMTSLLCAWRSQLNRHNTKWHYLWILSAQCPEQGTAIHNMRCAK